MLALRGAKLALIQSGTGGGRDLRALRGLWRLVTRWYVSIVLVTALGVAVGYFAFFNLGPGRPQIGIIDIPFTVIDEESTSPLPRS